MDKTNQNGDETSKFVAGIPIEPEDVKSEEKKEEPEKKPLEEKPKENASPENNPEKDDDKEKKQEKKGDDEKLEPNRPERYIPVQKYTAEKKESKRIIEEQEKRIKELETIAGGKTGSEKNEKQITEYAEKYGVDVESVKELAKILQNEGKPTDKKVELSDEDKQLIEEAKQIKAEKAFEKEFKEVAVPTLKSLFPNANDVQLAKLRTEVEKMATSDGFLDKPLDYVVFKHKGDLEKIIASSSSRKGPEDGNPPLKKEEDISALDFKDTNDFSKLNGIPPEKFKKIVDEMDLKTWTRYKNWVKANEDLEVS